MTLSSASWNRSCEVVEPIQAMEEALRSHAAVDVLEMTRVAFQRAESWDVLQ